MATAGPSTLPVDASASWRVCACWSRTAFSSTSSCSRQITSVVDDPAFSRACTSWSRTASSSWQIRSASDCRRPRTCWCTSSSSSRQIASDVDAPSSRRVRTCLSGSAFLARDVFAGACGVRAWQARAGFHTGILLSLPEAKDVNCCCRRLQDECDLLLVQDLRSERVPSSVWVVCGLSGAIQREPESVRQLIWAVWPWIAPRIERRAS